MAASAAACSALSPGRAGAAAAGSTVHPAPFQPFQAARQAGVVELAQVRGSTASRQLATPRGSTRRQSRPVRATRQPAAAGDATTPPAGAVQPGGGGAPAARCQTMPGCRGRPKGTRTSVPGASDCSTCIVQQATHGRVPGCFHGHGQVVPQSCRRGCEDCARILGCISGSPQVHDRRIFEPSTQSVDTCGKLRQLSQVLDFGMRRGSLPDLVRPQTSCKSMTSHVSARPGGLTRARNSCGAEHLLGISQP